MRTLLCTNRIEDDDEWRNTGSECCAVVVQLHQSTYGIISQTSPVNGDIRYSRRNVKIDRRKVHMINRTRTQHSNHALQFYIHLYSTGQGHLSVSAMHWLSVLISQMRKSITKINQSNHMSTPGRAVPIGFGSSVWLLDVAFKATKNVWKYERRIAIAWSTKFVSAEPPRLIWLILCERSHMRSRSHSYTWIYTMATQWQNDLA